MMMWKTMDGVARCVAISGSGDAVVGLQPGGTGGVHWTEDRGAKPLGLMPWGISFDGRTVVGMSTDIGAALWKEQEGVSRIEGVDKPRALSGDGRVVVGSRDGCAVKWTTEGKSVLLPSVLQEQRSSEATAVSNDGSVIIGWARDRHCKRAVRWENGRASVLPWGGGYYYEHFDALPTAISSDGLTIIGLSHLGSDIDLNLGNEPLWMRWLGYGPHESFRWRSGRIFSGRMKSLGQLPSALTTLSLRSRHTLQRGDSMGGMILNVRAFGVSGDGSVVVGEATETELSGSKPAAFLWTQSQRMQKLIDVLNSAGVQTPALGRACGVSSDGMTIVGNDPGAWIVRRSTTINRKS